MRKLQLDGSAVGSISVEGVATPASEVVLVGDAKPRIFMPVIAAAGC